MNTYWTLYKITTFWESHWPALWVVIDGFPSNFPIDFDNIQNEMNRRKPWQSKITTQRNEDNDFEVLSWIFEWKSTGQPITILVRNKDQKSRNYDNIKDLFRPNHADLTYQNKYWIRDYRWGWRSSARETVSRVIAWAIAKQYLRDKLWVKFYWYVLKVWPHTSKEIDLDFIEKNIVRCPDKNVSEKMLEYIEEIKNSGDSVWWIIECLIQNPPKNLWEPVFWKIKSRFASSMLSIWAAQWFEYWAWFNTVKYTWSEFNEWFIEENWEIKSENNKYEWILWWISTGEDIKFRVAFKPTASIYKKQKTVSIDWKQTDFQIEWRHDPCVVPRAVPIVEAMAAIDILDLYLIDTSKR